MWNVSWRVWITSNGVRAGRVLIINMDGIQQRLVGDREIVDYNFKTWIVSSRAER